MTDYIDIDAEYDRIKALEGTVSGAICSIAMEKVYATERVEPQWCFGERKRVAGTWTCKGPTFEALMETQAWGWAEPVWS